MFHICAPWPSFILRLDTTLCDWGFCIFRYLHKTFGWVWHLLTNEQGQTVINPYFHSPILSICLSLTFLAPEIAFINYPFESRHNAHEVKSRVSDLDHHGNLFKRGDRSDGKVKRTDDSPPCQRTFRQFGLTRTLKNITDKSVPKVTFTRAL